MDFKYTSTQNETYIASQCFRFSPNNIVALPIVWKNKYKEMVYLTMHSTHFIYGCMVSDIWDREETCCCHMVYSFRLAARVLLCAPFHRQDSTYHGLCYTSCGALAGMKNAQWIHHEGSIWRSWANALREVTGWQQNNVTGFKTC